MATTAQVEQLRSALRDVDTLAARELLARWRTYTLADAAATMRQLLDDLPALTGEFAAIAASIAADWYEEVRNGPTFRTALAPPPAPEQVEALARWATGPLWGADTNPALALSKVGGGVQRIVLNGARDTITLNANRDPAQPRVARRARPDACAFCALIATRGAVFTEETADFKAHDRCHCVPVPVFPDEDYDEPDYVETWRDAYQQAREVAGGKPKPILAEMRKTLGTN